MRQIFKIAAIVTVLKIAASDDVPDFLSDTFIDFINSNQSLWRAGRNFHHGVSLDYINLLAGTISANLSKDTDYSDILHEPPPYDEVIKEDFVLPENFDIRVQWPNCPIMNSVRDQGPCGSCWAVAAVAAMTDRYCIASNGKDNFNFAAQDVLSCCLNCGSGCGGGVLLHAWTYYKRHGIVSGGEYQSDAGCQPYRIPPCDHHYAPDTLAPCGHSVKTPPCETTCERHYKGNYGSDKKKCKLVYTIPKDKVMKDIYKRGPVTTTFELYADFLNYKSGVYKHLTGKNMGLHSVKLMGWGVESGVKYWLAANTWNQDWGDKGFFKIIRDLNHCGIEQTIIAGI